MATPVIIPKQGQSVESCIIVDWYVKKGDFVNKGDLLYTYETDKSSFDEESPSDGFLLEILFHKGDEVPVLSTVAIIGEKNEHIDELLPEKSVSETRMSDIKSIIKEAVGGEQQLQSYSREQKSQYHETSSIKISPRAANLAAKMNINVLKIQGSGPEGRIIEKDIMEFSSVNTINNKLDLNSHTGKDIEVKKLSNIRKIISDNIYASLKNSAQITHHLSAHAEKIINYRNKIKKLVNTDNYADITLNDLICFAVIKALKANPDINSHFLGDSIKIFRKVNLGFAVDTERGLMVPVIKNADDLDIKSLSGQLKALADNCRKGNIDPELLKSDSASFTVSNLGAYGIEMFTPIINLPQTGILGINSIIQRPIINDKGKTEIVPIIGLSYTYDHRAIDGAPASAFLKEVKNQIENIVIEL